MTERLAARGVGFRWGSRTVLEAVDLEARGGECVAVVGPNGAGKTTLLRLLAGVARPGTGAVLLDGEPLDDLPARRRARRVAYVPQRRPSRIALSVGDFVLLGRFARARGLGWAPGRADFEAAERAMVELDVIDLRRRRLDELSGGERQAAFLAAALAQGGDVLVLDEPTAHLDPRHVRDTARRIDALRSTGDLALVVATHDLGLAAWVADRATGLRDGRVAASGRAADVLESDSLARLFGAPFTSLETDSRTVPVLRIGP